MKGNVKSRTNMGNSGRRTNMGNAESRALYEKYKGMRARVGSRMIGTVVGWSIFTGLIVVELRKDRGWKLKNEGDHFLGDEFKPKNGKRYWYIVESDIIK